MAGCTVKQENGPWS